jgi:hypothetical protein
LQGAALERGFAIRNLTQNNHHKTMFPGNQLLLEIPGIKVLATDAAKSQVDKTVHADLEWFRHGPDFIERVIRSRYPNDPIVTALLERYLHERTLEAIYDDCDGEEETLRPWKE